MDIILDLAAADLGECSAYLAALDEASYVESILPTFDLPDMTDTREDDDAEAYAEMMSERWARSQGYL